MTYFNKTDLCTGSLALIGLSLLLASEATTKFGSLTGSPDGAFVNRAANNFASSSEGGFKYSQDDKKD